jgi:hypothetical protein
MGYEVRMRRWSGISLSQMLPKAPSKTSFALRLSGAIFLISLLPSLGLCRNDVYFQINTGAVGLLGQPEISRYWSRRPTFSGEVGCYLAEYLSPSISMSYTSVTLNWDQVERGDTSWAVQAASKRSYMLTGSFALKLSDFQKDNAFKILISVGSTFLMQRIGRVQLVGWDGPVGIPCQRGSSDGTPESKGMILFDIGAGIGVGRADGAIFVIQSKFSFSPDLENVYLPLELGLRF